MENEITGKVRKRNRKPRQESRVHEILRRGCMNYLVELHKLGKMLATAEEGGVHPTEYLVGVNQWSTVKGQLYELEKHHTVDVNKLWR
jgi:hypothetical protein|tara:strand:+ start:1459 stop:1722 length:264 start_codon:yes stop_codon:yes gene_type:complete